MHGSIRELETVTQGIKVDDTPILHMNMIYYIIMPYQALRERILAEMAGIGINGENKWTTAWKKHQITIFILNHV